MREPIVERRSALSVYFLRGSNRIVYLLGKPVFSAQEWTHPFLKTLCVCF